MLFYTFLFVTCLTLIQFEESYGGLPSYMKACRRFDPKLNECVLKVGKASAKVFSKGDPATNIPRLDPLKVKEIKTAAFESGKDSGIKILFTNVEISGLKDLDLKKLSIDVVKQKLSAKATVNLTVVADYDLSGRLLIFPLVGKGKSRILLNEVKFAYTFEYNLVKKNGIEFGKFSKDDIKYEVGSASFQLENLFNGDKVLGPTTNTLLNENWKEVVGELAPPVVNAIRDGFQRATEAFLAQVPYDELLLIP